DRELVPGDVVAALAARIRPRGRHRRRRGQRQRRDHLRLLPGVESIAARSDRSTSLRVRPHPMQTTKGTLFIALVVFVAGCKVGPNYHAPDGKMPASWLPPT